MLYHPIEGQAAQCLLLTAEIEFCARVNLTAGDKAGHAFNVLRCLLQSYACNDDAAALEMSGSNYSFVYSGWGYGNHTGTHLVTGSSTCSKIGECFATAETKYDRGFCGCRSSHVLSAP